jgi:hypothetical protein
MHRRPLTRILGTAVAVLALLPLTASGATAVPAVDATDFPGVRQVAAVVPTFAGGSRTVENDHAIWIFRRNCSSYVEGPRGEIRKWAYYYPADDGPLLWVHIQKFASADDAKRAIRVIRHNIEGCYGTHHIEATDATLIRRPADVPPLGAGRPVAWKMNDHWTEPRDGFEHSYYSRRIWMREGETVIGVDLWGDSPVSRDASIRLARLALTAAD